MNDNDKKLKVDDDAKNCKIPVTKKQAIQRSAHFWHNACSSNVDECLQFANRTREKSDLRASTAMTKRLSCIPTKKVPQIHESGRKVHADKRCAEPIENTISKTVKNPRSRNKHEGKYSKVLDSNEKSNASVSRKQQSALKTNRDKVINESNGNKSEKTPFKTNKRKSLPKVTEAPCKAILSAAEHATRREHKEKNCYSKRGGSSRTNSKDSEKVDQAQKNYYSKKYSEKVNAKHKIELNSKQINNNVDGFGKSRETKEIIPHKIVENKKTQYQKTIHNGNDIKSNIEDNGAARTRIFERQKRSEVNNNPTNCKDSIRKKEDECSKNEFGSENSSPTEKHNRREQETKTSDSTEHKCDQDSIDPSSNDKKDKIISLYNRDLTTPESSTDYNEYQEFGETCIKMVEETTSNNVSFTTSTRTSCEKISPGNAEVGLKKGKVSSLNKDEEVCQDKNTSKKDEQELITELQKTSDRGCDEIKKSLTVSKIPATVAQDEICHHTNLINYGYHSDQQHCKRYSKQCQKPLADEATILINADKNQNTVNNDAKYDLMKALIQPAAEIHDFKSTDNNIGKVITSGRESECLLASRDGGLQDFYINSWSHGNVNEDALNVSSNVKQPQNNIKQLESFETLKPHTSAIHLNEPLSNTSDYISMNLKSKGCKYTKKYRHFKHEEKNMWCDMAHYIKRMVSDERKYQEFEKIGNLEKEELKIIIDENSPKTSKIRIVNDRSSVSVECHSLGRTLSPSEREIILTANKAESSGGESSGYKSFHNSSNTRNVDTSDWAESRSKDELEIKHSAKIPPHNTRRIQVHYNPPSYSTHCKTLAEPVYKKANLSSSENFCDPLHVKNPGNECNGEVVKDLDSQENVYDKNHEKRNTQIEYSSYDTKNYLSTFTNCMDVYSPCEIIAYQFEEEKKSKILHFNNNELREKDVDDAELHIGQYLTDKNSDTKDELSEGEESNEQLASVKDLTTSRDEVTVLKEPDNVKDESLEFLVNDRLQQLDNPRTRTHSTEILAAPAQYRIITSHLNLKSEETTEPSENPSNASYVKFTMKDKGSTTAVKSSIDNIKSILSYIASSPATQVTTNDIYEKSATHEATYSGRYDNKNDIVEDSNAVHELWTNKKSAVDSTDNDSQSSGKTRCGKCAPKRNDANKFKFNIFRKLKSSASEKTINIPLDQLPKPPPSFLENSTPSQSTIHSLTTTTNASESDFGIKTQPFAAPILRTNSLTKPRADTAPVHYARKTHKDSVSNENMTHSEFRMNSFIAPEDAGTELQSLVAPEFDRRLLVNPGELRPAVPSPASALSPPASALPPPASALPPPYPFCCPLVPYMMQYWQNGQPPPATTVPLPEADWKSTVDMLGSEPPPPAVVPIPWFPPMMHVNNTPPGAEMDSRKSNALHAQPPPEWLMMPRGYAPCFPCSKTPESHLGKKDSSTHEDDESALGTSEIRQDGRKKKVSNKLFKIFRKKNRADFDTLDENDRKSRGRHQSRIDSRLNNMQVVQDEQQHLDDQSIWESPDIAGIVTPEEIGRCFRRGFRADGLTLSGEDYLCTKAPSDTTSGQEDVFNFSDHDTPLDFLLALGFSVDEATAAIRDEEVRSRFKAALTEARIWVPHIATTQGTLLYLLAMKAKPKVMRYFLQLVESIVNKRITNAVKLDAYLKILEKVEEGYVSFVTLFGRETGKEDEEDTVIVEKQRRRIFYTIFKYAESEAKEVDRPLTTASVDLLHSLAARYKPAIGPHLRLLACYIGEGLLTKDVQLEAALIYLSRLDSSYVRLEDLEKYCGLPPSERRRAEQIAKTQS